MLTIAGFVSFISLFCGASASVPAKARTGPLMCNRWRKTPPQRVPPPSGSLPLDTSL
jgi:hypothetical protein